MHVFHTNRYMTKKRVFIINLQNFSVNARATVNDVSKDQSNTIVLTLPLEMLKSAGAS